jgi:putative ABC transport system permease protein
MRSIRALLLRAVGIFGKPKRDQEFAAELESHLQMHIDDNLRSGMSSEEARRIALIQLGGIESVKENYRDRSGFPSLESFFQDVRHGARVLARNPSFTLIAVLVLALGIGVNTALFSVVYGVLLRPLPYTDGSRLVVVKQQARAMNGRDMFFSPKEIADYRAQSHTLDAVEEYHSMGFILLGNKPSRVQTGVVSSGFFPMLGVRPLLGRTFLPSDDQIGAPPVLILSYGYWQREFGGDPKIVGRTFKMNDRLHTVVGVLPFIPQYPRENDVYMPVSACPTRSSKQMLEDRDARMMRVFAHLKPGVPMAAAASEMRSIGKGFERDYPASYPAAQGFEVHIADLQQELTQDARPLLLLLLGTTALVLLICCTNVANLSLARVVRREHEFAVRAALGASRGRLARQLLTESTLLAVTGGLLGWILAAFSLDVLVRFIALFTTRAAEVSLNTPVLIFTLAVSVLTGLLFGSFPAFAAGRRGNSLKLGGVTNTVQVHRSSMRGGLIIAEVALSFVLLTGAGLMIRTLIKLHAVDAGYDPGHVVTMHLPLNWSKYDNGDKLRDYEDRLLTKVSTLPGVTSVGLVSAVPLDKSMPQDAQLFLEGQPVDPARPRPRVNVAQISPGAFHTLGIPILSGRGIEAGDRPGRPQVVVVSQSMAKRFWPGENPIGKRISGDNKDWATVVGVAGDVRQFGLDRDPVDTAYIAIAQDSGMADTLALRVIADPMNIVPAVRNAITSLDPEQPIIEVKTLDEIRGDSILQRRLTTTLLGLFAGLALIIAATGLAGVTAFLVSQRTREIGIRLALGAQVRQIETMVLSYGTRLLIIGSAIGVAASYLAGRGLQELLFQVKPLDWPTLLGVAVVLIGVSLGASYVPARRATRVDPMIALRYE